MRIARSEFFVIKVIFEPIRRSTYLHFFDLFLTIMIVSKNKKNKKNLCHLHFTIAKFGKLLNALRIEIFFEIVGILILNATG